MLIQQTILKCDICGNEERFEGTMHKSKEFISLGLDLIQNDNVLYQEQSDHHFCSLDCLHKYLSNVILNYSKKQVEKQTLREYNERQKHIIELEKHRKLH